MRSALEQLYHAKQMEFKPNLFWWIVSVVLLSPQLGVHLKLDVLHAIGEEYNFLFRFLNFKFLSHLEVYVPVSGVHVPLCHIVVRVSTPVVGVGEIGELLHTEAFPHCTVRKGLPVNLHLGKYDNLINF